MSTAPDSSSSTSARALAVESLNRIDVGGAYVSLVAAPDEQDLDRRTERQTLDYVAGVTRWRRWLDFLLTHFYRGPFEDMEPTLKQVLRIGLYDLLIQDVPPHAAVHEAVELAKQELRPGAGRLANGVLRAVQRQRDRLPEPTPDDPARHLAIRYSHPTWMVRRWVRRFGPDATRRLLTHNNTRPIYGVRLNLLQGSVGDLRARLTDAEAAFEPSPYLDDFVRCQRLQPLVRAGLLDEGVCAVQDEAAGLVVRVLDPQPGETVIDTCAAPGGKTLYAATRMQDDGRLHAFDVHPGRLKLVEAAAEAHGVHIVRTLATDLRELPPEAETLQADRVLLDAPCSGLGVLSKRADLRWNRSLEELTTLTSLQDELLDAAARLVRPGGVLVYSTCTTEPEENEERIERFLSDHPAFELERVDGLVPDALVTREGYYASLPHRDGIDGAFAARLRRRAE